MELGLGDGAGGEEGGGVGRGEGYGSYDMHVAGNMYDTSRSSNMYKGPTPEWYHRRVDLNWTKTGGG